MKKQLIVMMVSLSMVSVAKADLTENLKKYGIPCAVSLLAGSLLAKDSKDGMAGGAAACLGISTATYLGDKRLEDRQISESEIAKIKDLVKESQAQEGKVTTDRLQAIEAAQKSQIEDMRAVIREVIADRMMKMEDSLKQDVSKKLESGEFMPKLEKNLSDSVKREVLTESRARQKEIVEKCVEQTIKEVIAKPIGVPENSTGVDQ